MFVYGLTFAALAVYGSRFMPYAILQDYGTASFGQRYVPPWQTMPSIPSLPEATVEGTLQTNGVHLWYAMYGPRLEDSLAQGNLPIVFLHGGFANSEYFSHQIISLKELPHTLITIDTRGHGRSSDDLTQPITYDMLAQDVLSVMDILAVQRFSIIGWSDGGCTGFNLAMNHSERIDRVFAFGGTHHYENINSTVMESDTFSTYMEWAKADYGRLSPTPDSFEVFEERMEVMWTTQPVWDAGSFARIPSIYDNPQAPLIWIVAGDSEEAVSRDTPGRLQSWIWGSSLVVLPAVGHFGFLQDPRTFNAMLQRFLAVER
ncbi:alpha/beta-hydrolase [Sarocladium strictum]